MLSVFPDLNSVLVHPALSGFPPVIVCLLVLVELFCFAGLADEAHLAVIRRFLLSALLIALPFTYFSGWWAADEVDTNVATLASAVGRHQLFAKAFSLSLVLPVLAFVLERSSAPENAVSRARLRALYVVGLLLSFFLIVCTGALGGELVFEHGVGREAADGAPHSP